MRLKFWHCQVLYVFWEYSRRLCQRKLSVKEAVRELKEKQPTTVAKSLPAIGHTKLSSQLFKYIHSKLSWIFDIMFFHFFSMNILLFAKDTSKLLATWFYLSCAVSERSVTSSDTVVILVVWITCMPVSGQVIRVSFRAWGRSCRCFGLFLARVHSLATLEGCRSLF